MDDDPIPFQFPPQQPAFEPPAEEFREPKRKRGRPKGEGKKRGPKPGSKRKPKAVSEAELERRSAGGGSNPQQIPRQLSLADAIDMANQINTILEPASPAQRKELLTYLLGQQ